MRTRKGLDTLFDYKNHVKVDRTSKLIVAFTVGFRRGREVGFDREARAVAAARTRATAGYQNLEFVVTTDDALRD